MAWGRSSPNTRHRRCFHNVCSGAGYWERRTEIRDGLKYATSCRPASIHSYLPDREREALPTGHAVLHLVILGPLPGQRLWLLDLKKAPTARLTIRATNFIRKTNCQHICTFIPSAPPAFLHWPGATGSLCRAPAWPPSCRPASSSAPPPSTAASLSRLHPLHTWNTTTRDAMTCVYALINWLLWIIIPPLPLGRLHNQFVN